MAIMVALLGNKDRFGLVALYGTPLNTIPAFACQTTNICQEWSAVEVRLTILLSLTHALFWNYILHQYYVDGVDKWGSQAKQQKFRESI